MHAPLDLLEHLEGAGKRSILSFHLPSYTQRLQLRPEIWGFLKCTGLPLSSGRWFWTLATHHLRMARSFYWKSWITWILSRHKLRLAGGFYGSEMLLQRSCLSRGRAAPSARHHAENGCQTMSRLIQNNVKQSRLDRNKCKWITWGRANNTNATVSSKNKCADFAVNCPKWPILEMATCNVFCFDCFDCFSFGATALSFRSTNDSMMWIVLQNFYTLHLKTPPEWREKVVSPCIAMYRHVWHVFRFFFVCFWLASHWQLRKTSLGPDRIFNVQKASKSSEMMKIWCHLPQRQHLLLRRCSPWPAEKVSLGTWNEDGDGDDDDDHNAYSASGSCCSLWWDNEEE